jgi:putative hydrolase of the HAD superfamily
MREFGMEKNKAEFDNLIQDIFNRPEPEYKHNGLSLFERRVKVLSKKLGLDISIKDIHNIAESVIDAWQEGLFLDPQAITVLEELNKKYSLALVTNWEHTPRIYTISKDLGLDSIFDEIIISDEVGVAKPDPRILTIALERTGLSPHEVCYVGDGEIDVVCSINAGVKPILIKRENARGNWFYGQLQEYGIYDSQKVTIIKKLDELTNHLL